MRTPCSFVRHRASEWNQTPHALSHCVEYTVFVDDFFFAICTSIDRDIPWHQTFTHHSSGPDGTAFGKPFQREAHRPMRPSKPYSFRGLAHTAKNMIFGIQDLWKTFGAAGIINFVLAVLVRKDGTNLAILHQEEPLLVSMHGVLQRGEFSSPLVGLT